MIKRLVLCKNDEYSKEFEELVIDKNLEYPHRYFVDNLKEFNIEDFWLHRVAEVDISKNWTILGNTDIYDNYWPEISYLEKEENNYLRYECVK